MAREFVHLFERGLDRPLSLRVAAITAIRPRRDPGHCEVVCGGIGYEVLADAYKVIAMIEDPDSFDGAAKSPTPSGEAENRDSFPESALSDGWRKQGLRDPGKSTT